MEFRNRFDRRNHAGGARQPSPITDDAHSPTGSIPDTVQVSAAERMDRAILSSPIAKLWLQTTGTPDDHGRIPAGLDRSLTPGNILIGFELCRLLIRLSLTALSGPRRNHFLAFFGRRLLVGLVPAAVVWVQAQLMDLVQCSMTTGQVKWYQMGCLTTLNLLLSSFNDIYKYFAGRPDADAENDINQGLERAYLSAKMSLSIPSLESRLVQALMLEGAIFIGVKPYQTRKGSYTFPRDPFDHISELLDAIKGFTQIISLTAVLVRAIFGSTTGTARWLFVGLCVGPTAIRLLGGLLFGLRHTRTYQTYRARSQLRSCESMLKDLGKDGIYKQENVLFGLRDWVLNRLAAVQREIRDEVMNQMQTNQGANLYLAVGQNSIEAVFYIAMVSQMFGNAISLGTARLCQAVAANLARTLRSLGDDIERSFQAIFYMAAFVECINLPQDLYAVPHAQQSVRFELTRPASGGVNIVARNLSFSYSHRKKPTLQNINLSLAAGETLAIVGLNGGGKTTLVKVLMGLYDYEGELLINGVSARSIDKQALYSRTSCLFQDYNMYPVTLRENVGVGRVEKMDDVAAILRAMEKGKADAVAKKLGSIETLLARNASRVGGAGDDDDGKEKNVDKSETQGDKQDGEQDEKCPDKGTGCSDAREEPNGSEARDEGEATKDEGQAPKDQGAGPKQAMKKGEIPRDVKSTVLSGGQWQRVALARAFLRAEDADLVVFDEPSASLDPRAEAALFERIHTLSTTGAQKPTTIYISHRFSTVRKADKIAVVEDGTIVEVGSHAELMRLDGRYAELFNLQKEAYESD